MKDYSQIIPILDNYLQTMVKDPPKDGAGFHSIIRQLLKILDENFSNTNLYNDLLKELQEIDRFNSATSPGDDITARAEAIIRIVESIREYISNINSPHLKDAIDNAVKTLSQENVSSQKLISEALENAENSSRLANELVDNVRTEFTRLQNESRRFDDSIKQREIVKNTGDFRSQATQNKWTAVIFLAAAITVIIIFACSLQTLSDIPNEIYNTASKIRIKANDFNNQSITLKWNDDLVTKLIYAEIIKKISIRVLMYSLIIYTITLLVKNFTAQMHNYVVNSNIANALESMTSLINTTKTKAGNDAMLTQITQAIFSSQKSGYLGKDSEINSPNMIANVIEAAKSSKS